LQPHAHRVLSISVQKLNPALNISANDTSGMNCDEQPHFRMSTIAIICIGSSYSEKNAVKQIKKKKLKRYVGTSATKNNI